MRFHRRNGDKKPNEQAPTLNTKAIVNLKLDPFVVVEWGEMGGQWTPDEARNFAQILMRTAEVAEAEAVLGRFMRVEMGGSDEALAAIILKFREFRGDKK